MSNDKARLKQKQLAVEVLHEHFGLGRPKPAAKPSDAIQRLADALAGRSGSDAPPGSASADFEEALRESREESES